MVVLSKSSHSDVGAFALTKRKGHTQSRLLLEGGKSQTSDFCLHRVHVILGCSLGKHAPRTHDRHRRARTLSASPPEHETRTASSRLTRTEKALASLYQAEQTFGR